MIGSWLNGYLRHTNLFPQTTEVNIAIRTDASSVIGSGHLMRCLAIANELKNRGASVLFITVSEEQKWIDLIRGRGFSCETIKSAHTSGVSQTDSKCNETNARSQHYVVDWRKDSTHTREIIEGKDIDWLIVDHYGLDWQWESSIRDCVNRILVIDDLVDRAHDCDALSDCVYGRMVDDYKSLVPRGCKLLLGTKYAPLRPEFLKWREFALERRRNYQGVKKILVSLGGTDKSNLTGEVLNQLVRLELPDNIEIEVVVGLGFAHQKSVEDQIASLPIKVSLNVGANDMASRIVEADLGIGAIGVSAWERFCLGLPAVNLITESHQLAVVKVLQKERFSGVVHSEKLSSTLVPFFKDLVFDHSKYREYADQCSQAIDGKGLFRLAQHIESEST